MNLLGNGEASTLIANRESAELIGQRVKAAVGVHQVVGDRTIGRHCVCEAGRPFREREPGRSQSVHSSEEAPVMGRYNQNV